MPDDFQGLQKTSRLIVGLELALKSVVGTVKTTDLSEICTQVICFPAGLAHTSSTWEVWVGCVYKASPESLY